MRAALAKLVDTPRLSRDVYEVASKSLGDDDSDGRNKAGAKKPAPAAAPVK